MLTLARRRGNRKMTLRREGNVMREPVIPQLNADEFLRWDARQSSKFELHHGFVLAFAGGSIDHDRIGFNIRTALERLFPSPCRTFGADVKLKVGPTTFFYCDAGVIRVDSAPSATFVESPHVVVEVLSPSTRAYDLVEKRAAYRCLTSLQWYLIAHTDARRIEIDARTRDGAWETNVFDDARADLGGRALALDEAYARSSLER